MGKKNKEKHEHNKAGVDPSLVALLNAIDISVMFQEMEQKEWEPEKHTDIENYLHYKANLIGR